MESYPPSFESSVPLLFGHVDLDTVEERNPEIQNDSSATIHLTIHDINPAESFVFEPISIKPDGIVKLKVYFKPTRTGAASAKLKCGDTILYDLSGEGRENLRFFPASVNFGNVLVGQRAIGTCLVLNSTNTDYTLTGDDTFTFTPSIAPSRSPTAVVIRYTPSATGAHQSQIQEYHHEQVFVANGTGVEEESEVPADGLQDIQVTPAPAGDAQNQRFQVKIIDPEANIRIGRRVDADFGNVDGCGITTPHHCYMSANKGFWAESSGFATLQSREGWMQILSDSSAIVNSNTNAYITGKSGVYIGAHLDHSKSMAHMDGQTSFTTMHVGLGVQSGLQIGLVAVQAIYRNIQRMKNEWTTMSKLSSALKISGLTLGGLNLIRTVVFPSVFGAGESMIPHVSFYSPVCINFDSPFLSAHGVGTVDISSLLATTIRGVLSVSIKSSLDSTLESISRTSVSGKTVSLCGSNWVQIESYSDKHLQSGRIEIITGQRTISNFPSSVFVEDESVQVRAPGDNFTGHSLRLSKDEIGFFGIESLGSSSHVGVKTEDVKFACKSSASSCKIRFGSDGEISIESDRGKIHINSVGGNVSVDGNNAKISSAADMKINAPQVSISGAGQAEIKGNMILIG